MRCGNCGNVFEGEHASGGGLESGSGMNRLCTVCGFEMEEGPRDFNICPSCGTEFGLHDLNASIESLRAAWLASGRRWHSTVLAQPPNWEPSSSISDSGERETVSGAE